MPSETNNLQNSNFELKEKLFCFLCACFSFLWLKLILTNFLRCEEKVLWEKNKFLKSVKLCDLVE